MKKSVFMFLVTVATVAAVGFAVAGCKNQIQIDEETGGRLTVTGIPEKYEGLYAAVYSGSGAPIISGWINRTTTGFVTLPEIKGGKVSIPLWYYLSSSEWERYTGNDSVSRPVLIYKVGETNGIGPADPDVETFRAFDITFTNGNATVNFADGRN